MSSKISEDVLTALSTLEIDGNNVRITAQLDRKLYQAVNKVLQRIGGKWNRKAKAHVFDDDPTDRLNNVIECGVLDPEVKTGYYPTPPEIVDKMIELADLKSLPCFGMILEPSAGQGHIVDKIMENGVPDSSNHLYLCENLPENVHILEEKGYLVQDLLLPPDPLCLKRDFEWNNISISCEVCRDNPKNDIPKSKGTSYILDIKPKSFLERLNSYYTMMIG